MCLSEPSGAAIWRVSTYELGARASAQELVHTQAAASACRAYCAQIRTCAPRYMALTCAEFARMADRAQYSAPRASVSFKRHCAALHRAAQSVSTARFLGVGVRASGICTLE